MSAWSPRLETKASREPSGDQRTAPFSPRTVMSALAVAEPSTGTIQIWWSFVSKATRPSFGESAGRSPSPMARGSPPSKGTDQTCTFAGVGTEVALTVTASSQLPP